MDSSLEYEFSKRVAQAVPAAKDKQTFWGFDDGAVYRQLPYSTKQLNKHSRIFLQQLSKPKNFTRVENLMPSANYVYPSPLGQIPETDYPILPRAKSANSLLPINGHVSLKITPKISKKKFHVQLEYQIIIFRNQKILDQFGPK